MSKNIKIAWTLGGELRNSKTAFNLLRFYKEYFKKSNIDLHFYGCFWKSSYADFCIENGYLDVFNDYVIEEVPKNGVVDGQKGFVENNITGRSTSLYNWSYGCYRSNYLRKMYQLKSKDSYRLVFFSRPDIYIPYDRLKAMPVEIQDLFLPHIKAVDYTMYIPPIRKALGNSLEYHYHCDDLKVVGDQRAMDVFSTNFHLIYINNSSSYVGSYHNLPAVTCKRYDLEVRSDLDLCKKWMILREDDGIEVYTGVEVEKEYKEWLNK